MFGDNLRKLRIEKGISQLALAKMVFVSGPAVSKWERNESTPNPETIVKLSEIFNVSADYLLGNSNIKKPPEVKDNEWPDELASYSKDTKIAMQLLTQLNPENLDKAMDHLQYLLARQAENKDKK